MPNKTRMVADYMKHVYMDNVTNEVEHSKAGKDTNAPEELDTIAELAAAIGNNPNYAADMEASDIITTAAIVDIQDRYITDNP